MRCGNLCQLKTLVDIYVKRAVTNKTKQRFSRHL